MKKAMELLKFINKSTLCRLLKPTHKSSLKFLRGYSESKNPFSRTWNLISTEVPVFLGLNKSPTIYPEHTDVVIIGSGFIGASAAYWLKTRAGEGLSVVVLEKDFSFQNAQKSLSLGRIHQHYSLPENIQLAQYSAEFLRNTKKHLCNDLDINYCPHNHLVLASDKYAHKLEENIIVQREYGVKSELYTDHDIKFKYPWMNINDVKLGCTAIENEGTFNPWALLQGFIQQSKQLGTNYVNAEVTGFELEQQRDVLMEGVAPGTFERINKVIYKTSDNQEHSLKFAICILAAGDESGEIAKLAKIGNGPSILGIPLPIKQRESKVFLIDDKNKTTKLSTPHVMDTSGLWFRKLGLDNKLLCGHLPLLEFEEKNLSDTEYLDHLIKPTIINRVPSFENHNINKYFTEIYDYNSFDDNGIIGPHPYHNNMYIASGFGMQGCAHAPAIGRALAELVIDSQYTTIDLTRFCFDRLFTSEPLIEFNVY